MLILILPAILEANIAILAANIAILAANIKFAG